MTTRVPIITDLHFGARGDSEVIRHIQTLFYRDVFWPAVDAERVTDILCLGDLMDRRKFLNYETLDHAKAMLFSPARTRGIRLHWVLGNHDLYFKQSLNINASQAFKEYENLVVYSDATVVPFNGTPTLLMPWLCEENMSSSMKTLSEYDGTTVAGHFEFGGFEMYKGSPNYHGASTEQYDHFPLVMSGHYHHRSSRRNIHYLGSPYEMTWGDYGDKRGFHWWTPEATKIELVENPHNLFFKYVYDDSTAGPTYVRDLLERVGQDNLLQRIIKVIVRQKTKPVWYEAFAEAMLRLGAFDVQFVEDTTWSVEPTGDATEEAGMDTLKMIEWYVDGQPWPNAQIQQSVRDLLVDLYHEASERAKSVARN